MSLCSVCFFDGRRQADQIGMQIEERKRLDRELATERERADRNEQDAERWRFARDDYKNFAIMQNIGHDWTRLEPSEANAAIDAARKP